jgi:hypothetical protein
MARKVRKVLNIDLDVIERLEEEENQSQYVTDLLRDHFDMADEG